MERPLQSPQVAQMHSICGGRSSISPVYFRAFFQINTVWKPLQSTELRIREAGSKVNGKGDYTLRENSHLPMQSLSVVVEANVVHSKVRRGRAQERDFSEILP